MKILIVEDEAIIFMHLEMLVEEFSPAPELPETPQTAY